jgi:hypothetical protein
MAGSFYTPTQSAALDEFYATYRQEAQQRNSLMGRPIMEQAAWDVLSESERHERYTLAVLALPIHDLTQLFMLGREYMQEKLYSCARP